MDAFEKQKLGLLLQQVSEIINEVLSSNEEIAGALEVVTDEGYEVACSIEINFNLQRKIVPEPQILVQDGEIRKGIFASRSDKKFLRGLKIQPDE